MHLPFVLRVGDHPRVCGEKGRTGALDVVQRGSPPRMRGKVRELLFSFHCARITPAYAGKSLLDKCNCVVFRDHPRVCGEKLLVRRSVGWRWGSPPRMRGKGRPCPAWCLSTGITPAYAGKSIQFGHMTSWHEDHPRVCGEKKRTISHTMAGRGSPPRMRGKGNLHKTNGTMGGITPAYAGKSSL